MGFSAVLAALGLTLAGVGTLMWSGRIPPNRWIGFRTPRTLSDRRVWYVANRIAGRDLAIAGPITAMLALVLPVDVSLLLLVPLVPLGLATAHSFWAVSAWLGSPRIGQADLGRRRPRIEERQ